MYLNYFSRILGAGLFLFIMILGTSSAQTIPFTGEVNAGNINIRSDSTTASEIVCQINKGARLEIISQLYDWYKIRLPKLAPSYVKKDLFECVNYENIPGGPIGNVYPKADKRCLNAKAIKDRINVRLKPDESSPVIGRLGNNEVVGVIKTIGAWYRIEPAANSFGWINKKFVNKIIDKKTEKAVSK